MTSEFVFTPHMRRTMVWIMKFQTEAGRMPNGEEIAEGVGMAPSNCHRHLLRLVEYGLLNRRAATSSKQRPMWHYSVSARGKDWLPRGKDGR